jgi:molybdopterin-binding protein
MNTLEPTDLDAPKYRIGQAAQLLGVSPDTVRRWADSGKLKVTRVSGGSRYVNGTDLARLAVELADEEGRERTRGQSARNSFLGIVTRVTKDGVAALVEVQSGPHRFVALITREAVDEMGLQPGMMAKAVVKATNVGIELAERL